MRRNNRELNIFSMSALDLFCSAMGAFLLLALIALPYYLREEQVCEVCPAPAPIPTSTPQPAAEPVLKDKLIVAAATWNRATDVDLHVITPDGHFSYQTREIAGRPGEMFLDDLGSNAGPRRELWLSKDPTPGRYQFCVHWYSLVGFGALPVSGTVYKPSGAIAFSATLPRPRSCVCPVSFDLGSDYVPSNVSTTPRTCNF
jgi:hypothetical protein